MFADVKRSDIDKMTQVEVDMQKIKRTDIIELGSQWIGFLTCDLWC